MAIEAPVLAETAMVATTTVATPTRERYHFTQREYYALVEAGVFTEDSRIELVQGDIVTMAPIDAPQAGLVNRFGRLFHNGLGERAAVTVQNPIVIGADTEPQPDLTLCKPRADDYTAKHPRPDEILLVVEVADSSVRYDRDTKVPLYAAAGIAEAWLLDLNGGTLEVYRTPSADGYKTLLRLKPGDTVSPLAFPDLILEVAALLPPPEQSNQSS